MEIWSWLLAAIGLAGLLLAADRPVIGFGLAVLAQPLWTTYAIVTQQWGFIIAALVYVVVYTRLFWKAVPDARKDAMAAWVGERLPIRVKVYFVQNYATFSSNLVSLPVDLTPEQIEELKAKFSGGVSLANTSRVTYLSEPELPEVTIEPAGKHATTP